MGHSDIATTQVHTPVTSDAREPLDRDRMVAPVPTKSPGSYTGALCISGGFFLRIIGQHWERTPIKFWCDLLVNIVEIPGSSTYTWPTAAIIVRDHFDVVATLDGRSIVNFDLSVGSDSDAVDGFVID